MKRIVSFLLTVLLLAGCLSVPGLTFFASAIDTGSLVTFGSYPQTIVTDSALLADLNSENPAWNYYEYYYEGVREDYMQYADATLDGKRYRAVRFSRFRPHWLDPDDEDSPIQMMNGFETDTVYWFRYEPLIWRVLDAETGLLMSEKLIDSQPFNNTQYDQNWVYYGDADCSHFASDWKYSSLRAWMNDDFFNTAFGAEKDFIRETVLTSPSAYGRDYDAEPTTDKVFPLSRADALNGSYGFDPDPAAGRGGGRLAFGTDYAKCQGLCVYESTSPSFGGASWWRLRTPYLSGDADNVTHLGEVRYCVAYDTSGGIRPVMTVDIQAALSQSLLGFAGDIVILEQPKDARIITGNKAEFVVRADGAESYQWQVSSDGGKTWIKSSALNAATNRLRVSVTISAVKSVYRCRISNADNTVYSDEVRINMENAWPIITTQPADVSLKNREKADSIVRCVSLTAVTYRWEKSADNGKTWSDFTAASSAGSAHMRITATEANAKYLYRCRLTNSNGKTYSNCVRLTLTDSVARITAQPSDVTLPIGSTAKFTVKAAGVGLKYQWQISGSGGKTWINTTASGCRRATLSVPAIERKNGYQYRCIITDKYGNTVTSRAATLYVGP